jgi:hypothetical protein
MSGDILALLRQALRGDEWDQEFTLVPKDPQPCRTANAGRGPELLEPSCHGYEHVAVSTLAVD